MSTVNRSAHLGASKVSLPLPADAGSGGLPGSVPAATIDRVGVANWIVGELLDELGDRLLDRVPDRVGTGRVAVRRALRNLAGPAPSVPCGLRCRSGPVVGFTRAWSFGVASLAPGRLALTASRGGVPVVRFEVVEVVDLFCRRRPGGLPRPHALGALITPEGQLEWLVHPELMAAAMAALQPGPATV